VHATLSPRLNLFLLAAWIIGAVAALLIAPVAPWMLLALGGVLGAAPVRELITLREAFMLQAMAA
jgi:hypothetical protein